MHNIYKYIYNWQIYLLYSWVNIIEACKIFVKLRLIEADNLEFSSK